jgi:hypothetical protein
MVKQMPDFRNAFKFVLSHLVETVSSVLMLLGIILSFFYLLLGGFFVGLSIGIGLFDEITFYFFPFRKYLSDINLYKILMLIGLTLFFLIAISTFLIGVGMGICLRLLFRLKKHH